MSKTKHTHQVSLMTHREVCKRFGVSTDVLMRAVRRGEFVRPHSCMGSFHMFDRAIVEHRLEEGVWPAGTQFYRQAERA